MEQAPDRRIVGRLRGRDLNVRPSTSARVAGAQKSEIAITAGRVFSAEMTEPILVTSPRTNAERRIGRILRRPGLFRASQLLKDAADSFVRMTHAASAKSDISRVTIPFSLGVLSISLRVGQNTRQLAPGSAEFKRLSPSSRP
jgi:hypothetical protein